MPLSDTQLLDLVAATQKNLGPPKFQQIAQSLVDYPMFKTFFKKGRVMEDGGHTIRRQLMKTTSGNVQMVQPYQVDSLNVADIMGTIEIPWRHTRAGYALDRLENAMNSGKAKIFDLTKTRRADAQLSIVEYVEPLLWAEPASTSLDPMGIPYWVVKNASEGFNGAAPTNWAAGAGGLLHANWQNWTGTYANVSKTDLIRSWRKAMRKTGFKSPIDINDYRKGRGARYRNYVNDTTIGLLEEVGEQQNDNLGRDLAPMDGMISFKRTPIVYEPALDADTSNPVYGLDHSTIYTVVLEGEYMRESEPRISDTQSSVVKVFIDFSWNIMCIDRRRNFVLYVA